MPGFRSGFMAVAPRWSAIRAIDLPAIKTKNRIFNRFNVMEETGVGLSRMPNICKTATIAMPRRKYFSYLLEYLCQSGFEVVSLDFIRQRLEAISTRRFMGLRFRFVISLYGVNEHTGVIFGVYRPFLSRMLVEKTFYTDMLKNLESLIWQAAAYDPTEKQKYVRELLDEMTGEQTS